MRFFRFAVVLALLAPSWAGAQTTPLQGGPWTPGHVPQYVGQGSSQPVIMDGGPAAGGAVGVNVGELGIVARSPTNVYPSIGQGTGAFGSIGCMYDAPITNATGYHFLCLSPNATGNVGLLSFGAAGGASNINFDFNINGTLYTFPFVTGGIVGPGTTVSGDVACWNNTVGTLLKDCGAPLNAATNNTWTGTNNFTSTFQIMGATETFPASGNIVGTSDVQTLTNKSISGSEINSGTLTATVMPAFTGDVTNSAGTVATTISAGAVTNAKMAAGAANTIKGSVNGSSEADLAVGSCSGANQAINWTSGTGPGCATLSATTAGFGLNLATGVMSISQSQPPYGFDSPVNMGLTATAGASALTINIVGANGSAPSATNPVLVPFRSTTLATGTPNWAAITSATSLVIPSGATLGTASSNVPFRIWLFLEYNAGAPELVVAVCSTTSSTAAQIYPCSSWEYNRTTTTTISGLAASAGVPYSTTGVSNDAMRIIGYCDYASGLGTAGAWASACTTLQLFGPGVKKPGDTVQGPVINTAGSGVNSTTTTKVQANPSIAFTPTSTVNPIHVYATAFIENAAGGSSGCNAFISRGTSFTALTVSNIASVSTNTSTSGSQVTLSGLDLPATVSSTTYVPFLSTGIATNTCTWNGAVNGIVPSAYLEIYEIMGALAPTNDNGLPLSLVG